MNEGGQGQEPQSLPGVVSSAGSCWQRPVWTSALVLVLALWTAGSMPAQAAAVALGGIHMAAAPGGHRPAVTRFPSGVRTVYFDYKPLGPYPDDDVEVRVFAGGLGGAPVARAKLIVGLTAALSAALRPGSGAWPDGGYCTVLYVDGVPDPAGGRMPIGWVVGSAQAPVACRQALRRLVSGGVVLHRAGARSWLRVSVRDGRGRPVQGATVRVDGRAAGMTHIRSTHTGRNGIALVRDMRIVQAGRITIRITKPGFRRLVLHTHG